MSKQSIVFSPKKKDKRSNAKRASNHMDKVPYEHTHSYQKYLRGICKYGGVLKSLDINAITMFDSVKAVAMETVVSNESFYIGITYIKNKLCFLFCFGENEWYTIQKANKTSNKLPDGMNVYIDVNGVKMLFYPEDTQKSFRIVNFQLKIENGYVTLEE